VIADKYLEKINELKFTAPKTSELQKIEVNIAQDLSEKFQEDFYCVKCDNKFDVGQR
jgi:hypothetical protein